MSLNTASSFDLQIPRGDSDAANRVLSDFLTGTWFASPTAAIATYNYDPAGNRRATDGLAPGASNVLTTYTSGQGNRLTSYSPSVGAPVTQSFDANGNLLVQQSGSAFTTYTWDGENRLLSIALSPGTTYPHGTIVTNLYDGAGLRQGYQDSTGRTTLTYDGQNVYRRDVQSIGSVQRYTSEPGNYSPLISQADTRSGVTTHIYAVSDLSGNIRNWWSSGTRGNLDPYAYEAYGVEWITPAPEPPISYNVPFFYEGDVGYYQDATTGLYYVKARWYDPVTGRFMGEDPEWPEGGWNPYEFVENNPVNLVDVDGMVPRLTRQPIPIPPTDPGDLPGNCSIYKWLYTGDWCAPDDVYNAAIGGGADGLTCWANCFVDANKQILAIVAAAAGTSPAWGATKPIQWMRPGARPLTSVARLINIQVRQRFGSAAADKIGTQALADFIKEHPTIAAAELAAVVFAWAEAAISAYCAAQCVNSSCNINNDQ